MLQVVIPTYNRPGPLEVTLRDLLPQVLGRPVSIMVIDNDTPGDLESVMRGKMKDVDISHVIFCKNKINVGLYANILRCFEFSDGPYLWIISDDDRIPPGAVEAVLRGVHDGDVDYLLANDSRRPGLLTDKKGHGLELLVGYFSGTGSFLPTSIYRREHFLPYLRVGYQYLSSGVPHLALVMAAAVNGLRWRTLGDVIVDFVPTRDGSYQRSVFYDGFPLLTHLASNRPIRESLSQGIWRDLMGWLGPWGVVRSLAHGEFFYASTSLTMSMRTLAILLSMSDGRPRWGWHRWFLPLVASFFPGGIRKYSKTNESVQRN